MPNPIEFYADKAAKDSLIWHGTLNGKFSIRSAYHMEKDLQTI